MAFERRPCSAIFCRLAQSATADWHDGHACREDNTPLDGTCALETAINDEPITKAGNAKELEGNSQISSSAAGGLSEPSPINAVQGENASKTGEHTVGAVDDGHNQHKLLCMSFKSLWARTDMTTVSAPFRERSSGCPRAPVLMHS